MTRRGNVIQIRVSDEEKERIANCAKLAEMSVSDWLRSLALDPEFTKPRVVVPPPSEVKRMRREMAEQVAPDTPMPPVSPTPSRAPERPLVSPKRFNPIPKGP